MTRDELIIHWREVLAVPDDVGDASTRQMCRHAAAVLLETVAPLAEKLGTPRPSLAEQQTQERLERELAQAVLDVAREEARSATVTPLTPAEREATERLAAIEAKLAELDVRVAVGELVPKADVVKELDRRFVAAIEAIRVEARAIDASAWDEEQRKIWIAGVIEPILQAPLFRATGDSKH